MKARKVRWLTLVDVLCVEIERVVGRDVLVARYIRRLHFNLLGDVPAVDTSVTRRAKNIAHRMSMNEDGNMDERL